MYRSIICDLDGTLCNCEHRVHLAKDKNWDVFNKACVDDSCHEDIANILRALHDNFETRIILVSGRSDNAKDLTEDWLLLNDIPYDELHMRVTGDFRSDDVIKQEILDKHIEADKVWFVLDDRKSVVDMWRKNDLTCLQVQEGDF